MPQLFLTAMIFLSLSFNSFSEASNLFVAKGFNVPLKLDTSTFRLRKLTAKDTEKDFDAVNSSISHLQFVFESEWPKGITLEENLSALTAHEEDFNERTAFTYTVVELDESRVLGCVYINPTDKVNYDAEIYLWARQSELKNELEVKLQKTLKNWLKEKWPFKKVIFLGKNIEH